MKKAILSAVLAVVAVSVQAQIQFPRSQAEDTKGYMSEAYWKLWNPEEQARIEADIEKYRKADGEFSVVDIKRNSEVKIEQISHEFIFGAHIFNFNQLGTKERNDRYKEMFGTLFNRATIPFYWREFELEQGKPRFATEYRDTEEFWNNCENPYDELHWRRPSTDQLVEFCEQKGIQMHGHVLVWGSRLIRPRWYFNLFNKEELAAHKRLFPNEPNRYQNKDVQSDEWKEMSFEEVAQTFPNYVKTMPLVMENRIKQIAEHYGGRLQSWDVVNESARDDDQGFLIENHPVSKSRYGLLYGDYPYHALKCAEKYFPSDVALNINDYHRKPGYTTQVKRLLERGCKIDIMGIQMHLFNVQHCMDIANGVKIQTPSQVREYIGWASEANLPLHLSEVTITAPSQDERGFMIQAIITQQLYRLWFSQEKMMGITWWNTVDGCGIKGEPSVSGIFFRDMKEKPAYYALDQLINHEWKTNLSVKPDAEGKVRFRGFKGKYRITYKDKRGREQTMEYILK
ncbi:MAG: 1,4-beta-xylanase [Rikenellaceae bacterium]|nr:1,4-beta-xylanase [Rikenellaceae bacterium]